MKVLVVGIDGTIGRLLWCELKRNGFDVFGTTRRHVNPCNKVLHFDLVGEMNVSALPFADVTIICAAQAGFAACRQETERTERVNVTAPAVIGQHMAALGGRIIALSSSAVFDCLEPCRRSGAPRCPRSKYGEQKKALEDKILSLGRAGVVLRLSKVIEPGVGLLQSWIDNLSEGLPISAFTDHSFCPVSVGSVVSALISLSKTEDFGTFQMSGARDISYAEAAYFVATRIGASHRLVRAGSALDSGVAVEELLTYTSLDGSRLHALCGFRAPDPESILELAVSAAQRVQTPRTNNYERLP
jgi:dTDP-4-dehydrorhamnose reductase